MEGFCKGGKGVGVELRASSGAIGWNRAGPVKR